MKTLNQLGSSYDQIIGLAKTLGGLERGEPRDAASLQEAWARRALIALTAQCDGALTKDDCGFNKPDTNTGRYLGHFLESGGTFDDVEWRAAVSLCRKYHGQVGRCPAPVAHDHAVEERLGDAVKALRARTKFIAGVGSLEPDVVITKEGDRLLVESPYKEAATVDFRAVRGRRWEGASKVNTVPVSESRALHALLCKHFAGKLCHGPKGLFVIGGAV